MSRSVADPFDWVPAVVRRFGDERSDAYGTLDVQLAPIAAQTRIVRAAHRIPLQIQRAQYRAHDDQGMATLPLLMVGGGILQGDRFQQVVRLAPHAHAHLITPAATKIYRMERGYAAHETTLIAEDGALLEYLPAPIIAQRGARYAQRLTIVAAPTATVLCGEILIPGRLAMGERGAYDTIALITERRDATDGRICWRDALLIEPAALPHSVGTTETIGTLFALASITAATVHAALASEPAMRGTYWGTSDLPEAGIIVRIAGGDSRIVQAAHTAACGHLRALTRR